MAQKVEESVPAPPWGQLEKLQVLPYLLRLLAPRAQEAGLSWGWVLTLLSPQHHRHALLLLEPQQIFLLIECRLGIWPEDSSGSSEVQMGKWEKTLEQ